MPFEKISRCEENETKAEIKGRKLYEMNVSMIACGSPENGNRLSKDENKQTIHFGAIAK